jgi:hypothetical protein
MQIPHLSTHNIDYGKLELHGIPGIPISDFVFLPTLIGVFDILDAAYLSYLYLRK